MRHRSWPKRYLPALIHDLLKTFALHTALYYFNSRIKTVRVCSRGSRNNQRFINANYFHLGGLDLLPKNELNLVNLIKIPEEPHE